MLLIKTTDGAEIRLPIATIEEIKELEKTGEERAVARHPYLHRDGVQRCAACWRPPLDPAHADIPSG